METYDLPIHQREETYKGDQFQYLENNVPKDLTNIDIVCVFRRGSAKGPIVKTISEGEGLTKFDAVNGWYRIEPFDTDDWEPDTYYFAHKFTEGGVKEIHIRGTLPIIETEI